MEHVYHMARKAYQNYPEHYIWGIFDSDCGFFSHIFFEYYLELQVLYSRMRKSTCCITVFISLWNNLMHIFLQVMKSCSKLSKIFLTAMVYELYKTGMGETTFEKVNTKTP